MLNKDATHAWNILMNEANLTQVTGPTVLAIVQESIECNKKEDEIEKMRKAICKDS